MDKMWQKAEALASDYKAGDRLYYSVLHRHFSEMSEVVADCLVDKGYFRKDIICRCPKCSLAMFVKSVYEHEYGKSESVICYNCDEEIKADNLIEEPVLIRLRKECVK